MTYLLDSSVLIDALNDRNGRPQFLAQLSQQDILLACCAVNVTELYMGMRPGVLSPVRNARISAGFVVEPLAGTRWALYSSFYI